jgi:hypothetical protein
LVFLTAAVHLGIDGARKDKQARTTMSFSDGGTSRPNALDDAIRRKNVPVLNDSVRQDDVAYKNLIAHGGPLLWFIYANGTIRQRFRPRQFDELGDRDIETL